MRRQPHRYYGVGVDCPPHLIGRPLIPELYIRTREVPEYFPPAEPWVLDAIVGYCITVWRHDAEMHDLRGASA